MEILCRRADPGRIVWGSDFGFGLADTIGYRLSVFKEANVEGALRGRILGENARRLLGIQ
jgi:predicted TIM-barrel fold metal-dependent hydrolase